jgi:hypothetical protein
VGKVTSVESWMSRNTPRGKGQWVRPIPEDCKAQNIAWKAFLNGAHMANLSYHRRQRVTLEKARQVTKQLDGWGDRGIGWRRDCAVPLSLCPSSFSSSLGVAFLRPVDTWVT